MKKEERLIHPLDFKKTFKEGKRILSPHFALYARENKKTVSRVGISIAKSHYKLATKRNRLRRVAREFFKKEVKPLIKGHDIVVTSKASGKDVDMKTSEREIKNLIGKLK